jgi:hypothetical protein
MLIGQRGKYGHQAPPPPGKPTAPRQTDRRHNRRLVRQQAAVRLRLGHRGQQRPGVRVQRRRQHLLPRAAFGEPSLVHDPDRVAELPDHRHVVRDEQVRQRQLRTQPGQQVHDAGPDRNVQGRRRLVQDQDPRLGGQRAGDRHPLGLAARHLVRQPVREPRAERHHIQQLGHPRGGIPAAGHPPVHQQHLGQRPARGQPRVQRRERILGDQLQPPGQLRPPVAGQRPALQRDGPGGRLLQPDQQPGQGRLAAPALADHAQAAALLQGERHPGQRGFRAPAKPARPVHLHQVRS